MDLFELDTTRKSSEGVWFPLVINKSQKFGDDGKPIKFKVKGAADPVIRTLVRKHIREEPATIEEEDAQDLEMVRAAVVDWTANFSVKGEKVGRGPEWIDRIFSIRPVRVAVAMKARELEDFMEGPGSSFTSSPDNKPGLAPARQIPSAPVATGSGEG